MDRKDDATRRTALLLAATALGCLALAAPATAGGGLDAAWDVGLKRAPAPQLAQDDSQVFDIPAQPLPQALLSFSRTTGIELFFDDAVARGLGSPGVSGRLTPEAALERLLAGTGLGYRFTNPTTVTLERAGGQSSDGTIRLGTLTVQGRNLGERARGPVEGFAASRTAVGSKTDTPILEIPQSISVVGREELERRNVQTLSEAVQYTPGVRTDAFGADPRGYDFVSIRGFDAVTNGNFRDGLRMVGSRFAVYTTEPYGMERFEVLRGPAGALYGQADPAGIVDRVTKRPTAGPIREVEGQIGSWNRFQGAFDLGGALDEEERFLFRLTGLGRESETEFDYNDGTAMDNDRLFIAPAFTWRPSEDTELTLLADYMKDERSTDFGPFGGLDRVRTDVIAGEPGFDEAHHEQFSLGYLFSHQIDDVFAVRQNVRYFHVDVGLHYVYPEAKLDDDTIYRSVWASPDVLSQFAVDNQAEARFSLGPVEQTLLVGLDWSRASERYSNHYGPAPTLSISDPVYAGDIAIPAPYRSAIETLDQLGLYAQDQIELYDRVVVTLGGRQDWVDHRTEDRLADSTTDEDSSAFTGRAGVSYLFDFGLAPYVSYAEGFVPQTGADAAGNAFDPEQSHQYEVGLKYQPPGLDALFTLAAFDLTKTNVLTPDPDNPNLSVQTGEIRSRGIELEARGSWQGFNFTAAYSYLDSEVTESNGADLGKRPIEVPEHIAQGWLDYTVQEGALQGFGLGGGLRFIGASYDDAANTSETAGYVVADAMLRYDVDDSLSVQVNATNLFDREYVTTCAGVCYWGEGRQVIGTLTYRW